MFKKIFITCMVSTFLFAFSNTAIAKQFFMLLHYDNGQISVAENMCESEIGQKMSMLQIKGGQARTGERPSIALNNRYYQCKILGNSGEALHSSFIEIPPLVILGDWLDEKGELTGSSVELKKTNFVVRVPFVGGANQIKIVRSEEGDEIGETLKEEISIDVTNFTDTSGEEEGSFQSHCNLDIVVLGDRYTSQSQFNSDAGSVSSYIEGTSPFNEYASKMDWYFGSTNGQINGQDCNYNCGGIQRLICCDSSCISCHAGYVNNSYDEVIVLVDDNQYGGSAGRQCGGGGTGTYAVSYNGSSMNNVAAHEFGHSFGGLDDEYVSGGSYGICPNGNCCSNSGCTGCNFPCGAGCYDGCTQSSYYRGYSSCKMKSLGYGFCNTCKRIERNLLDQCW